MNVPELLHRAELDLVPWQRTNSAITTLASERDRGLGVYGIYLSLGSLARMFFASSPAN